MVEKPPATNKAASKAKSKLLSNYSSTPKSIPTSPALHAARSPNSTPVLSATQQAMERKREQRFALIHELAAKERTTEFLKGKWAGKAEEFMSTLEKSADYNSETKTWAIRKSYWRDLDVWKYGYESRQDREAAIDNAIRQYDKQRLSSSEIEWQRLLPKEERGKGKCLSRLQANLAKGPAPPAPKIKVQKADESSSSKDDGESQESDKLRLGGEAMSRTNSNSKARKPTAQEAQAKRLLSNSKNKPAAAAKVSPTKAAKAGGTKNGGRVLSAAIIENSDSSGDEAPLMKPKPMPISRTQDTVVVDTRPAFSSQETKKRTQPQQPVKRSRDDSDSSSSSGTPLSKRIKPKQPLPAPASRKEASKAASQSRNGPSQAQSHSHGSSHRKSNSSTSPTKSSPLAMSPPTNASELDEDSSPPAVSLKRKTMEDDRVRTVKRRAVESVPGEVMSKANKFKSYYQKYEALHYQISALDNPPHQMVANLIDMRGRLETMKKEIYKQYSPERD